jgi:hypothetical protein
MTQEEKRRAVQMIHDARRKDIKLIIMRVGYCRSYVKRILKKKDQDLFWLMYQDLLMKKDDQDYEFTNQDERVARELESLITNLSNAEASLTILFNSTS